MPDKTNRSTILRFITEDAAWALAFHLRKAFRIFVAFVFLTAALCVAATAQTVSEDKTLSPYFFISGDPSVDHLPLKDTDVDIAVSGVIADVHVKQTYTNEGSRPINATYIFPASTRAAVYSMKMRIGDQVIYAKIKQRDDALKIFEQAKLEGKSASLLEENRPNVFSMKLANVMPNERVEVELRYTELLVPEDGKYEVVYPTVVGPRYASADDAKSKNSNRVAAGYTHQGEQPASTLHIATRIASGVPITEISCPSHQIAPQWTSRTNANLILDEADAFQGNRDFILEYKLAGNQINSGLMLYQGEKENFFLYMAEPPARVKAEDIPPREYVFIVDVSGSMEGFPLNTSKQLLQNLIGKMRPTDYFNVVLFAGDSTVLSEASLPANDENIKKAINLLDHQRGSGGTELLAAVKRGMALPRENGVTRSLVLVTDGYVSGEQGTFDYIRDNLGKSNFFSFGIGSSVNRYLIEGIAKAGMGEPFVVEDEKKAAATAEKFREYIESPVLSDIKIEAKGFETYDVYPKHVPDLMAGRPAVMWGKWRGSASGTLDMTGRTGQGEFSSSFNVADAIPDPENQALRYLWARNRIAELSDYGSADISDDEVKKVTDLGLEYNLLTRYTSFVAVREKVVNKSGQSDDVDQPLPLPAGVSDLAIGAEPEEIWLAAMLVMFAAFLVFRSHSLRLCRSICGKALLFRS